MKYLLIMFLSVGLANAALVEVVGGDPITAEGMNDVIREVNKEPAITTEYLPSNYTTQGGTFITISGLEAGAVYALGGQIVYEVHSSADNTDKGFYVGYYDDGVMIGQSGFLANVLRFARGVVSPNLFFTASGGDLTVVFTNSAGGRNYIKGDNTKSGTYIQLLKLK